MLEIFRQNVLVYIYAEVYVTLFHYLMIPDWLENVCFVAPEADFEEGFQYK